MVSNAGIREALSDVPIFFIKVSILEVCGNPLQVEKATVPANIGT